MFLPCYYLRVIVELTILQEVSTFIYTRLSQSSDCFRVHWITYAIVK
jgi:hypothetical protein